MALPATDNFNRTADPLGSNWTIPTGCAGLRANGTGVTTSASGSSPYCQYWSADSFNVNQYSQLITVAGQMTSDYNGPAVRIATGAASLNCYMVSVRDTTRLRLYKYVNGTPTQLGTDITVSTMSGGETVKLLATGTTTTTLKVYLNGVEQRSTDDSSSPHTTGAAGIVMDLCSDEKDNWEGGDFVISAAITGTVTSSITETDIVNGGKTIVITLTNAAWISS